MNAKTRPAADDLEALFDSIAAQRPAPAATIADAGGSRSAAAVTATAADPASADDLEALFDQVAAERVAAPRPPAPATTVATVAPGGDSDDLEALFDQVAAARTTPGAAPAGTAAPAIDDAAAEHLYHRVGQLTRTLHDALRELGYDKKIATAAQSLPDARDRLAYIATLTGQAADKVLSAVEAAQADQQAVEASARELGDRWSRLYANALSVDEFRQLAGDTRDFLTVLPTRTATAQRQLHEIMMAQDFHDLTGQVIKKIVELAGTMEKSLVALLVETCEVERKADAGWLNGPAVGRPSPEVVQNQVEVDALLESLGF